MLPGMLQVVNGFATGMVLVLISIDLEPAFITKYETLETYWLSTSQVTAIFSSSKHLHVHIPLRM